MKMSKEGKQSKRTLLITLPAKTSSNFLSPSSVRLRSITRLSFVLCVLAIRFFCSRRSAISVTALGFTSIRSAISDIYSVCNRGEMNMKSADQLMSDIQLSLQALFQKIQPEMLESMEKQGVTPAAQTAALG